MTGWGVERDERTASRSVTTRGGSPLMPSHSQGAERRTERRAGHTGSRWALRALVIGGLAGAAWLLTGSAARAAGPDDLVGAALDDVATVTGYEPMVGELLEAAVESPEPAGPEIHRHDDVTSVPELPVTAPGDTFDQVVHDRTRSLPVTGSPRASGGTTNDRMPPVPPEPVADPATEPAAATEPAGPETDPVEWRTAGENTRADEPSGGVAPSRGSEAQLRTHAHRHLPAARPAPERTRSVMAGHSGSVPGRMSLGAVNSLPAGAPGAEAGSTAVLPARPASGAVDSRLLRLVTDVEARRHDAEATTVSPD